MLLCLSEWIQLAILLSFSQRGQLLWLLVCIHRHNNSLRKETLLGTNLPLWEQRFFFLLKWIPFQKVSKPFCHNVKRYVKEQLVRCSVWLTGRVSRILTKLVYMSTYAKSLHKHALNQQQRSILNCSYRLLMGLGRVCKRFVKEGIWWSEWSRNTPF